MEEDPNPDPKSNKKLRLMIKMRGQGKKHNLFTQGTGLLERKD